MKTEEISTLAWWCFWCLESAFAWLPWVLSTEVWYAWGKEPNPTYEQVLAWNTWHREAMQVVFDPDVISYGEILVQFWSQINPTDEAWQFADRGFSYTTAIWYHSPEQKRVAEESKRRLEDSKKFPMPVVTEIIPYTTFYPAEEYHQKYFRKSAFRYSLYRKWSWRTDFLNKNWSEEAKEYLRWKDAFLAKRYFKPSDKVIKENLDSLSYDVTQNRWTEHAFTSSYEKDWRPWIYVDIVSWEPLFSSKDQYDAWCWWPSFTRPLNSHFIKTADDHSHWMIRTEVRSKYWDSHLGHVFNDWPEEEWWVRFCINWAALRFVPKEKLEEEWYSEYLTLFEESD
ncbi:MAG: Methionine-R-sulfoxide reductase [uncultured bacterium (gcode 4)]|uniref:Peptide methionine sulfoxide reductase MsrA n=1 Tax=uncultured bacterium (gcode 4) TaxID=1234023 RepID=K2G1P4_9BACT|nr:MAG: Methionine-R-sulfoxide reductase [uncultured bacterium (gcode 4)]